MDLTFHPDQFVNCRCAFRGRGIPECVIVSVTSEPIMVSRSPRSQPLLYITITLHRTNKKKRKRDTKPIASFMLKRSLILLPPRCSSYHSSKLIFPGRAFLGRHRVTSHSLPGDVIRGDVRRCHTVRRPQSIKTNSRLLLQLWFGFSLRRACFFFPGVRERSTRTRNGFAMAVLTRKHSQDVISKLG